MGKPIALARSFLFVPADRPERFAKAQASGADQIVIDLEDAVAPAQKPAARAAASAFLAGGQGAILRLNGSDSPWFEADLTALAGFSAPVMLPKADLAALQKLTLVRPDLRIIALIESLRGLDEGKEIARHPNVERLAFGHLDFCAEAGLPEESAALTLVRSQLFFAARLADRPAPIDGVTLSIENKEEIQRDCAMARDLGFAGKLCIHPAQIAAVNAAFSPDAALVAWAQEIIAAAQSAQGAAVQSGGKMVDRPLVLRAQRIMALHHALG